jgi:hypothetical protein
MRVLRVKKRNGGHHGKSRFSEEQIVKILKLHENGLKVTEV